MSRSSETKKKLLKKHLTSFRCFYIVVIYFVISCSVVMTVTKGRNNLLESEGVLMGYKIDSEDDNGESTYIANFRDVSNNKINKVYYSTSYNYSRKLTPSDIGRSMKFYYIKHRFDFLLFITLCVGTLGFVYSIIAMGAYLEIYHGCGFLLDNF